MRYHHFRMTFQARFNLSCPPIPENNVPIAIAAAYPFPIRRETHLTSISSNGVARKAFLAILSEIVCAVDEDLVVQRLSGEVFIYEYA